MSDFPMDVSVAVALLEGKVYRLSMSRRVAIEKVGNFVRDWNTEDGLPKDRAAAIKPLEDLLKFIS